jgi:hypothetical protein
VRRVRACSHRLCPTESPQLLSMGYRILYHINYFQLLTRPVNSPDELVVFDEFARRRSSDAQSMPRGTHTLVSKCIHTHLHSFNHIMGGDDRVGVVFEARLSRFLTQEMRSCEGQGWGMCQASKVGLLSNVDCGRKGGGRGSTSHALEAECLNLRHDNTLTRGRGRANRLGGPS